MQTHDKWTRDFPERAGSKYADRWSAPGSQDRNSPAIWEALRALLVDDLGLLQEQVQSRRGEEGLDSDLVTILEIASGTGQQICFAVEQLHVLIGDRRCRRVRLQPTEADGVLVNSINQRAQQLLEKRTSVELLTAEQLEIESCQDWERIHNKLERIAVVFACNLTHIAPWQTTVDLFEQAAQTLRHNQKTTSDLATERSVMPTVFALYGAFAENGDLGGEGNRKVSETFYSGTHRY